MILLPHEVETFFYCPRLLKQKGPSRFLPPLTFFEECLRETFIKTEQICLLKNSEITPRKLLRVWDKIWWPRLDTNGISFQEGETLSVSAAKRFTEYSKYDFTSILYPTVATSAEYKAEVSGSFIAAKADILKANLTQSNKNLTIIDFTRKNVSLLNAANSLGIRTLCYTFYQWKKETIQYISVDISEQNDKLHVVTSSFREDDMIETKQMLSLAVKGIKEGVSFPNKWNCKECKECPSSYLMQTATLLK